MTTNRTLNNKGGIFVFDGNTVKKLPTHAGEVVLELTIDQVMIDFFRSTDTEEKIVLVFNRCGWIEFKACTRTEATQFLYYNGGSSASQGVEFGFRVLASQINDLMQLPDVVDETGKPIRMFEKDFVELANMLKTTYNKNCNLGNVAEYCISHNILDITDPTRPKAHDVYIHTLGKNGKVVKSKKAAECKASMAGFAEQPLATDLLIWDKRKNDWKIGLTAGYKKSNGAVKYDKNLKLKLK